MPTPNCKETGGGVLADRALDPVRSCVLRDHSTVSPTRFLVIFRTTPLGHGGPESACGDVAVAA